MPLRPKYQWTLYPNIRATASNISAFTHCKNALLEFLVINGTAGDTDALRGPRKSVDVAGCSLRPRSVWYKPQDDAMYGGRRGSRRHIKYG